MVLAFELSAALGLCPQEVPGRVAGHLAQAGLPTQITDIAGELPGAEALISLMMQDKKVAGGRLTFVLVRDIGAAFTSRDVAMDRLRSFLANRLKRTK